MAEEKINFELDVVKDNHALKVSDKSMEIANVILSKANVFVITNDNDKKMAVEIRAGLNRIIKSIDRTRIDNIEDFTADFTNQCNTLKALFDVKQKQFGEEIKKYTDAKKMVIGGTTETKKTTITIKTTNQKAIAKIKKICEEYEIEMSVK